ncbi:hypothetical protein Bca52824_093048 [Brassica carinata]|uniref:Saposin-like type B region 1 domain-containing protein n=1 Tax=Brassica carinata TaxID=52824 RepID=A0A8X7P6T4_BRACI|nr:hypothetical protein Bca52824_093048 [Brassica carinata]
MGVIKFGILFFFCFLLELTCDASNPIPSVHDNQVCELCDKYLTLAIDYLQNEDNQNAFVEALHMTCSQIPPLQKQCLAMVDRYTQRFFTQVSFSSPTISANPLTSVNHPFIPKETVMLATILSLNSSPNSRILRLSSR